MASSSILVRTADVARTLLSISRCALACCSASRSVLLRSEAVLIAASCCANVCSAVLVAAIAATSSCSFCERTLASAATRVSLAFRASVAAAAARSSAILDSVVAVNSISAFSLRPASSAALCSASARWMAAASISFSILARSATAARAFASTSRCPLAFCVASASALDRPDSISIALSAEGNICSNALGGAFATCSSRSSCSASKRCWLAASALCSAAS